jgi:hypothetical protein
MDERIRIFFCIVGGAAGFGLIGAAFGALARVHYWASGHQAGGFVGAAAVRAAEYVRRTELSERARAILSGSGDGACFLGLLGGLFGAFVGYGGPQEMPVLLDALLGGAVLAVAAVGFGIAGYRLEGMGVRVVALLFVGGMAGALLGAQLDGADGIIGGALVGALAGIAVNWLLVPSEAEGEGPEGFVEAVPDGDEDPED